MAQMKRVPALLGTKEFEAAEVDRYLDQHEKNALRCAAVMATCRSGKYALPKIEQLRHVGFRSARAKRAEVLATSPSTVIFLFGNHYPHLLLPFCQRRRHDTCRRSSFGQLQPRANPCF
jgi:hypothetical protein